MYDLFSETKEDGDNDGDLQSLAEDDDGDFKNLAEDDRKIGDGEEIFCHGE